MSLQVFGDLVLLVVISAAIAIPAILVRRESAAERRYSGLAVSSLICGIMGSLGTLISFWGVATPLADTLAIVFGAVGLHRVKRHQLRSKAAAIWGLALGVIGLVAFVILGIVLFIVALSHLKF